MATVTISLPESLEHFVEGQLAVTGHGDLSEYVSSLIREAQSKEMDAKLEALLLEAMASGEAVLVDDVFWNDLRADAARLTEARAEQQSD